MTDGIRWRKATMSLADLREAITAFLSSKRGRTRDIYAHALSDFVAAMGEREEVGVADLSSYFDRMRDVRGFRSRTIRHRMSIFRVFSRWLVERADGVPNLVADIRSPPVERTHSWRALSEAESKRFTDYCVTLAGPERTEIERRNGLMGLFALFLGLRTSSIAAVRGDDLEIVGGRMILRPRPKGFGGEVADGQRLALPQFLADLLSSFLVDYPCGDGEGLFANTKRSGRQSLKRIAVSFALRDLLEKSGVGRGEGRRITPHSLRHTAAMMMLRWRGPAGESISLDQIRRHLGHSKLATTQVYLEDAAADDNGDAGVKATERLAPPVPPLELPNPFGDND